MAAEPTDDARLARIAADPEFATMVRLRARLATAVVGTMVAVYFGYLLLLVRAPELLRRRVDADITVCFPLGLAVLVVAFVLVALHVAYSRSAIDTLRARIVERSRR